jgi:hypothetical protein
MKVLVSIVRSIHPADLAIAVLMAILIAVWIDSIGWELFLDVLG